MKELSTIILMLVWFSGAANATCASGILEGIKCDIEGPLPLGDISGGWTPLKLAGLTNTAVAIKPSAGWLGKLYCANLSTSWVWVQVFDLAAASVVLGTTTSIPYGIAPSSIGGFAMSAVGDQFYNAISIAATSSPTGGGGPAASINCNVSFN